MNKTERITILSTPEQRKLYESMARKFEGNLSMLIRAALTEYKERHMTTADIITTEYEAVAAANETVSPH